MKMDFSAVISKLVPRPKEKKERKSAAAKITARRFRVISASVACGWRSGGAPLVPSHHCSLDEGGCLALFGAKSDGAIQTERTAAMYLIFPCASL